MTTSRSQLPVSNLKERIAALEQRNAESAASVQRATSPTPSVTSNGSHSGSSNGALRDRIARFEKKGGVPVPKGRFGFGAPPSVEGPRKRGELYGNRIPVPVRTVSGGTLPLSRPVSTATYDQRRSFSTSSVISDLDDDHLDYSPMSSPTFTLPPDSPDSTTSLSITPDISPSLGDFSNFKQHIARGTSFAQALELARKAETEKQEREKSTSLDSRSPPPSEDDGHVESPIEMAPTIVISSADVSPVIIPELPVGNATPVPPAAPTDSFPLEKVQSNKELPYKPPTVDTSPVITTTTHKPLEDNGVARAGTPPLIIRKRTLADFGAPSMQDKPSKDPDTSAVPIEPQVLVSTVTPNPQAVKLDDVSSCISDSHKEGMVESLPTSQPKLDRQVHSENTEKLNASEILPPPDIVVSNERSEDPAGVSTNSNAGIQSHQVGLTLDATKLNEESLMSPPPQPVHAPYRAASASLGVLESFSTALASQAITPPDSLLSPPGTGPYAESPLSSGSSSSLGSRPISMFETSPKLVTQMLRMTPATSRGVPMFLPPKQDHPRKSDFLYFPPTPEDENTDVGSLTIQNSSHPNRRRRGSDPEDIRSMPSKQTFSAVVHRKVRELPASATVPDNKIRPLPQTPKSQRVKRATILETPLSPGHGELAALLHEAVLLEDTLNKGELPSEDPHFEEEQEKRANETAAAVAVAQAKAKAEEEERSQLALATAQLQSKRDEPTTGRLKHTFLVPLPRTRSQHRKDVHTTKPESISEEPKSAGPISQSTADSFAMASATLPKMPAKRPTLDSISSNHSTTQLPTKSSKSSKSPRFGSLRKLGSVSRAAAAGDGASARTAHSISSEVSSEESAVTAENSHEFGQGTGSTLSFPTVSPKKTSKTLARATSFAEKLWSRSRTKSGGSTLSSTSEVNDSPVKTPVAGTQTTGLPPSLNLPTLHQSPVVPLLSLEEKDEPDQTPPLRRSTSSKRSAMYFSRDHDLTAVPQLPPAVPGFQIPPRASPSSFLPVSNDFNRPSSANSVSSIGSLPSPLFSQELVDAFPSVPATTPATTNKFPHRDMSFASHTTTSFDTALLSSAIHLASTHKQGTPKASLQPLPSERAATPTATSGDVGHSLKV